MYFLYLSRGCAEQQLLFLLFAYFILVTWSLDETDISCLLWLIRRWNSNFLFWMSTAFPPFLTADNLHQLIVLTVLLNVRSVIMEETQRKQWQFRVGPVSCVSGALQRWSETLPNSYFPDHSVTIPGFVAFQTERMLFWWEEMWCNPASCWNASTWLTEESRLWCCCLNPVWIDTVWILLPAEVIRMTVAVVNGCE